MPKKVLVIGKNGQLGQSLQKIRPVYANFCFDFISKTHMHLNQSSIQTFFNQLTQPYDIIINAAAYTGVEQAEKNVALAQQVNHFAVKTLSHIAKQQDSYLVHLSTDYVFDGKKNAPYQEYDTPAPLNQYGMSKRQGEQAMLESGCRGAIIRTSWLFSEFRTNFVKTILQRSLQAQTLHIVADQVGSPTYATDLAHFLLALNSTSSQCRLYHFTNDGTCSWYELGLAVCQVKERPCLISPISSTHYHAIAQRPSYSVLDNTKRKKHFSFPNRHWRTALSECLTLL